MLSEHRVGAKSPDAFEIASEVEARGLLTSRGNRIDKKYLYRMLSNRAYIGEAVHKGESYPGEHDAIIDCTLWDKVHLILKRALVQVEIARGPRRLHFARVWCLAPMVQPSPPHTRGRAAPRPA